MKRDFLLLLMFCLTKALSAQDSTKTVISKKPGVSFELGVTACLGGASNNSGDADLSNLSYPSLTFSEGSRDSIDYKLGAGINAGFEINLLFGKKRNLGFGTGIHFTTGFNSFGTNDFKAEYKAIDGNGRSFKRVLSSNDWKEKVTYNNLSVPVLFIYRTMFGKKQKSGFFAEIGPVVTLTSSAKTTQEAVLDFGAVYATDGEPHYAAENSSSDWLITREAIEKHFSEGGSYADISSYFEQQYSRGYYVGLNKHATGSAATVKYKVGFGGLIRAGLIYQVAPAFAFTLGGQCLIVSSVRKTDNTYQAVETADDFQTGVKVNSLLNSTGSLLTAQYGLHIGLLFRVIR